MAEVITREMIFCFSLSVIIHYNLAHKVEVVMDDFPQGDCACIVYEIDVTLSLNSLTILSEDHELDGVLLPI